MQPFEVDMLQSNGFVLHKTDAGVGLLEVHLVHFAQNSEMTRLFVGGLNSLRNSGIELQLDRC